MQFIQLFNFKYLQELCIYRELFDVDDGNKK